MDTLATNIVLYALQFALVAVTLAGMWKVFEKAGRAGWKAIIPFYNFYVGFEITGRSGWWFLPTLLPAIPSVYIMTLNTGSMQGLAALGPIMNALFAAMVLTFLAFPVIVVFYYDIARSFGKGLRFTLGLVFLNFIFWPILGFSEAQYLGPAAAKTADDAESVHADHGENHESYEG